ncbi:MAG: response regulator transcription factor [Rhodospirillales bacterium]
MMMTPDKPIRVVIVDDHRLVREGVRALLTTSPRIQVVGEGADGQDAIRLIASHDPDILMMDVSMPRMSGLEAMREIGRQGARCRVLMLSIYDNPEYVVDVMRAGASGYILKDVSAVEMLNAVESIANGGTYLSNAVAATFIHADRQKTVSDDRLTEREIDVLRLIARGKSAKEIAKVLGVSVRTAETHRQNLRRKLNARNVVELTLYAILNGHVTPEA